MQYNDENINLKESDWQSMASEYEKLSTASNVDFDKFFTLLCELCDNLFKYIPNSSNLSKLKSFTQSLRPQENYEIKHKLFAKSKRDIILSILDSLQSFVDLYSTSSGEDREKIKNLIDLLLDIGKEINFQKNKKW